LYVTARNVGASVVGVYSLRGKFLRELPTAPVSEVAVAVRLEGDDILLNTMSFVQGRAVARYEARANRLVPTELVGRSPFSFDDAVVEREFAVSKDGTRVPVSIIHRKGGRLDGSNPTLLYGCGGYRLHMEPSYSPLLSQ